MQEKVREEIANFRFSLIAPVASRHSLSRGETIRLLTAVAAGSYSIPYSTRKTISVRTLENYLKRYREGGLEALKPGQRAKNSRIPPAYLEEAALLKRENPSRSIAVIIHMLEEGGRVPKGVLKRSTVYDYFQKAGLDRRHVKPSREHYRRFTASYRGEIFQGDAHHTLYLPDSARSGSRRKVFLFAWLDDYTRLILHAQFYWAENLPALEDCLKKAVIKHGIPENIYVDNAAVYSSHHLQSICGRLGIRLLHSRPYKPQGRGKIEKFFQFMESSFKSEALLLIEEKKIETLDDLNRYLFVWLDAFYHRRFHSATKQAPLTRWQQSNHELKKLPLAEIHEAFLMEKSCAVSKDGIIRLENNEYEVEPFLAGRKITACYDPYDLTTGIRVFFEDRRHADAVPAKIRRHHKKNYGFKEQDICSQQSGLNYLELLKEQKALPGIQYAKLED